MLKWIRRLWRRWLSRGSPQLSFRVSAEEKALVEFWAQRNGTTVSEFVRDAVARVIPTVERRKFEARFAVGEALDFVDSLVDQPDSPLPLLLPAPEPEPEAETVLHVPRNHNCAHLDDATFPKFFSGSTCYGTCDHRAQRGRPCFWPTQTAHQCSYYRPSKVPERA